MIYECLDKAVLECYAQPLLHCQLLVSTTFIALSFLILILFPIVLSSTKKAPSSMLQVGRSLEILCLCKDLSIDVCTATWQKKSLLQQGQVPIACFSVAAVLSCFLSYLNPRHNTILSFFLIGMTFRHMLYPAYKSNRTATPDTVVQGMQYLKASIKAMSIKVIEVN